MCPGSGRYVLFIVKPGNLYMDFGRYVLFMDKTSQCIRTRGGTFCLWVNFVVFFGGGGYVCLFVLVFFVWFIFLFFCVVFVFGFFS